ncbi:MAG: catechol 2,3-dioxygenase-like lactoylglutathione lyase family enzyme [Planctomycetota bacterium]|jgi:catechol 2,3-dioxygenase-like lactoylglutathione lyase family enzyme
MCWPQLPMTIFYYWNWPGFFKGLIGKTLNKPDITSQITWVYTDDLEHTSNFYANVLGLKLVIDEGAARIFEVTSSAQIGVCTAFDNRIVAPEGGMITLVTGDVDAWYSLLISRGVVIKDPPQVLEKFNIYSFFLTDPSGYVIEIQQFLE